MTRVLRFVGQVLAYVAFCAAIGTMSALPAYEHRDPEDAEIKVSFSHTGPRIAQCRRFSPEEIAALAPNMRRPEDCPRGRLPLVIEIELDGQLLYRDILPPAGIASDGASMVYRRFAVAKGEHHLNLRLRDTRRESGFDHQHGVDLDLLPADIVTVDFRPEAGGFVVR